MDAHPIRFRPLLKQTIWGGRRLGTMLSKSLGDAGDYAESWEIVDHGNDQSVVLDGPLAGQSLSSIIDRHREWLLGQNVPAGDFPLLLKYLDCNRVLSVQVHPDDEYGSRMAVPDRGKTEAWYIVSSDPGSLIYAGLNQGVDRQTFREAIEAGQTEQVLHSFHPEPGDVVFIPAGTVHALGAGLVVAEIQQSSDTTFRVFDWNRTDAAGNARPLHIEESLAVSDYESGPVVPRRADAAVIGWQTAVTCDKFVLRLIENGTGSVGGDGRFHIVTVPRGTAVLEIDGLEIKLSTGETVLLPAAIGTGEISPSETGVVLESSLPASES